MTEILDAIKSCKISALNSKENVDINLPPPAIKPPFSIETGEKLSDSDFILSFINNEIARHEIAEKLMHNKVQLSSDKRELLKASNEAMALKMKESSEAYSHSSVWEWLAKIARYLMHAITLCLGIGFIVTGAGAPLGAVLVAAGVAGITTELLSDIGGWQWIAKQLHNDEKVQKKIEKMLPTAMYIVTIFFSVLGAGSALYTGIPSHLSSALLSWEAVQSIIAGVLKIGKSGIDYEITMKKIDIDTQNEIISNLEKVIEMIHNQTLSGAKGVAQGTTVANLIMRTNIATRKLIDQPVE